MIITAEHIQRAVPKAFTGWAAALADAMNRRDIDTPERVAAFLAQVAHESAGLTRFTENLNYSVDALMRTWPSRFPSIAAAAPYARNPEGLANHVYANRLGNGNEASGDGWRYIGRGAIQITGRENYRKAGAGIGYPLERYPTDAVLPEWGAKAAAWYWQSHGLNELADADRFDDITTRINGGQVGRASRLSWLAKVRDSLNTINGTPNGRLNA